MRHAITFLRQIFLPVPLGEDGIQTLSEAEFDDIVDSEFDGDYAAGEEEMGPPDKETIASVLGRIVGFILSLYGLFEVGGRPLLEWIGLLQEVVC